MFKSVLVFAHFQEKPGGRVGLPPIPQQEEDVAQEDGRALTAFGRTPFPLIVMRNMHLVFSRGGVERGAEGSRRKSF